MLREDEALKKKAACCDTAGCHNWKQSWGLFFKYSILSVGSLSDLSRFEKCVVYVDSQEGMSVPPCFH